MVHYFIMKCRRVESKRLYKMEVPHNCSEIQYLRKCTPLDADTFMFGINYRGSYKKSDLCTFVYLQVLSEN